MRGQLSKMRAKVPGREVNNALRRLGSGWRGVVRRLPLRYGNGFVMFNDVLEALADVFGFEDTDLEEGDYALVFLPWSPETNRPTIVLHDFTYSDNQNAPMWASDGRGNWRLVSNA